MGRCENTRTPVTVDQIRDGCGHPETHLTIRPVIDLADHVNIEAYEVPDRITEPVALRDMTCVSPWCTRPARALHPDQHPADSDHIEPWQPDGTGGPAAAGSPPCAAPTTGSRPTAAGPTPPSNPAPTPDDNDPAPDP